MLYISKLKANLFAILFFSLLTSCSRLDKVVTIEDAAPDKHIDVSNIPNAKPKVAQKSR